MADYLKDLIKKTKEMKKEQKEKAGIEPGVLSVESGRKAGDLSSVLKKVNVETRETVQARKPSVFETAGASAKIPEEKTVKDEREEAPEKSELEKEIAGKKKVEIASYGNVKIFKVSGQPLLYYFVPSPRPASGEKAIINTIKEAATRLITISPYKIRDAQQRRSVYYQQIMEILRNSPELNIPERRFDFYANAVVREMVGYGLIDELVNDDKLEEIMVIAAGKPVYVFHREFEMMLTNIEFFSDNEIQDLVNRIARGIGRRIDISTPLLDARLPDGSRVNATIPPASVSGSTLTIRKFREDPYSLVDLINFNTLNLETAAFLWLCVEGFGVKPANILISGGTGSGKTTTLNVLASLIPENERIVTIEDTAELSLPLKHWIRLEARPPGLEGRGELTLDILAKNSLRMRPDRIIVGEVRHAEAFTLFTAINTGHEGSLGTIHANSSQETIVRVTNPPMNVPEVMLSGLDFIIVEHRLHDRKKGTIRRLTEISEVTGVLEKRAQTQTIFERDSIDDDLKRTSIPSNYIGTISKFTGKTRKQVEAELSEREAFLKKLVSNNIRSMPEFSQAVQSFIAEKRENA